MWQVSARQQEEHLQRPQGERASQRRCARSPGRACREEELHHCRDSHQDSEHPERPQDLSELRGERLRRRLVRVTLTLMLRTDCGNRSWQDSDQQGNYSRSTGQGARRARRWWEVGDWWKVTHPIGENMGLKMKRAKTDWDALLSKILWIFSHGFDVGVQSFWPYLLTIPNHTKEEILSLVALSTGRDLKMISPCMPCFSSWKEYFSLLSPRKYCL